MDYMTMNFNRNGGSGTSDYPQLNNKPQINGVTLIGNKTSADLGLMPEYEVDTTPTESSENLITSGGVWTADKNINNKLQGSKTAGSTDGSPFEIPDYGMTESIQMYFKPTQDLHGYDKPWAGGAGKNKLNYDAWKSVTIQRGTAVWENNGVTLTATSNDCYTGSSNFPTDARVPISEGETIILSWEEDTNTEGLVYIFPNDSATGLVVANNLFRKSLKYTATEGITYVTFKFGVANSGDTASYKNIMIRLSTESADFEPYANICPISGQDSATFEWTDSHDDDWELQMNFGKTCYGGFCQFNGQVYSQWSYIASYNGETLSGEWVSDRDEYVAGTTPTIGAEVAYYDSQSTDYFRVTPPANLNLTDDYPIEYNGYMANISYQPKNTVLAEAKKYTNQEIAKLGLPQPPTTDGTYHLECSVSGGIPTITWVLNS